MENKFKASLTNLVDTYIKGRKAMFIPIASVATFMLVGYAAVDKEAPKIESDVVEVAYGTEFKPNSITVTDNRDKPSEITFATDTSSLDMNQLGSYKVKVTATDKSDNSTTKTVNVKVVDKTAPKFEVLGANQGYVVNIPVGGSNDISSYIKVTDNVDGDVTPFVVASSSLDTSVPNTKTITLTSTDSSGNKAEATYQFVATDVEAPVISLIKGNNINIEAKTNFDINSYVSVTDNSANVQANIDGSIDLNKKGTYTYKITAKDASGNEAQPQTLTVNVVDTTAPTIYVKKTTVSVNVGTKVNFKDYYEKTVDNFDGDISSKLSLPESYTPTKAGTTSHTLSVVDASGNKAVAVIKVQANEVVAPVSNKAASTYSYSGSTNGGSIVSIAYSKLGTPYRFGSSGPSSFDCSGFTQWVYRQAGKSIPRTSGAQRSGGRQIPASQAQAGDIVCYNGHVGIYLGNGMMIHAPTTGSHVKVAPVNISKKVIGYVRY